MKALRYVVVGGAAVAIVLGWWILGHFRVLTSDYRYDQEELFRLESFPYDDWAEVLRRFVDDSGQVDYEGLRADRAALDRFVALVSELGPQSRPSLFRTDDQKLAYYLNAYNALVLFDVLDHWPLASPHDRRLSFFYTTRFVIDQRKANLFELENHAIRDQFRDPRVHFVLNCASHGCPHLSRTPLLPATLQQDLDRETARFLHEPRNVSVEDGTVVLSELFDWYAGDFAPSPLAWIRAHAPDLDLPADAPVRTRPWDWALNARS